MSEMSNHLPCQRQLFDIPEDVAYFNCAYMSPLLRAAAAAGQQGIAGGKSGKIDTPQSGEQQSGEQH